MTRSAMLEVLREDYIRTARAKGLLEQIIINRHALKNALLPVVTLIGIEFAFLIGGLVVTEQVFNLNGIGRLFVQSVQNQDYTLTQALVMLVGRRSSWSTNLVVDLLYAWLDPRIRLPELAMTVAASAPPLSLRPPTDAVPEASVRRCAAVARLLPPPAARHRRPGARAGHGCAPGSSPSGSRPTARPRTISPR